MYMLLDCTDIRTTMIQSGYNFAHTTPYANLWPDWITGAKNGAARIFFELGAHEHIVKWDSSTILSITQVWCSLLSGESCCRPRAPAGFIPLLLRDARTMLMWVIWCRILNSFNSLWPSDAIWCHKSGSQLAQVMTCCLTAPSHYWNQCRLVINKVQ